ncbi:MAG TPA: hypothetical protein ENI23_05755 [bacterium]|nr:hypothetical protein [bacterium]
MSPELLERIRGEMLDDDYPVFEGYIYLADNEIIRSSIKGTIGDIRKDFERKRKPVTFFNGVHYDPEIDYLFT